MYGLVDIPFDAFFKFNTSSTRGHPLKLPVHYSDSTINARAHSFPVRIVTLWNRLPAATVLSGSLCDNYRVSGALEKLEHETNLQDRAADR